MTTPIQLVFDTADPAAQARFWAEALGYELQSPPAGFDTWEAYLRDRGVPEDKWNDASMITDPEGSRPRILFHRVPEGKTAKNRMHMDLNASGSRDLPFEEREANLAAAVERLKALGASDARGSMEEDGWHWVRMNDPEGNEFCVY